MATELGTRQQFDQLYREHHRWLAAFLQRRLGCSYQAADLAQDTYLRLLHSETLPDAGYARPYLVRIARGLLIDLFRRRRIERAYLEEMGRLPEALQPAPEQQLQIIETLVAVDALLQGLPDRVRQAFLLRRVDGLSYREIAVQLEVSISSVEKYVARALQACLRMSLQEEA